MSSYFVYIINWMTCGWKWGQPTIVPGRETSTSVTEKRRAGYQNIKKFKNQGLFVVNSSRAAVPSPLPLPPHFTEQWNNCQALRLPWNLSDKGQHTSHQHCQHWQFPPTPRHWGSLGKLTCFFLLLPPSLPLSPDSQPQTPVIAVSVIGVIFPKWESALYSGNITPGSSLVDLAEGFVAFDLSEGREASSSLAWPPRACEGLPLAGGGSRGRRPSIPAVQEVHGGVPNLPQVTPSHHSSPSWLLFTLSPNTLI